MAAKKKTKSRKKTTLVEFRAWLEGVEEMQGDEWVPSIEQWRRIRNKIDMIEDAPIPEPVPAIPTPPAYIPVPTPAYAPGPSSLDGVVHQPAPPAPIELNPNAPIAKGQQQVKTPDIDTSSGEYKSSYE